MLNCGNCLEDRVRIQELVDGVCPVCGTDYTDCVQERARACDDDESGTSIKIGGKVAPGWWPSLVSLIEDLPDSRAGRRDARHFLLVIDNYLVREALQEQYQGLKVLDRRIVEEQLTPREIAYALDLLTDDPTEEEIVHLGPEVPVMIDVN